jgi:hypothetical protein
VLDPTLILFVSLFITMVAPTMESWRRQSSSDSSTFLPSDWLARLDWYCRSPNPCPVRTKIYFFFQVAPNEGNPLSLTLRGSFYSAMYYCPPPPARVLALRVVLARSVTFISPVIYGDLLTCRVKGFCLHSPQESCALLFGQGRGRLRRRY